MTSDEWDDLSADRGWAQSEWWKNQVHGPSQSPPSWGPAPPIPYTASGAVDAAMRIIESAQSNPAYRFQVGLPDTATWRGPSVPIEWVAAGSEWDELHARANASVTATPRSWWLRVVDAMLQCWRRCRGVAP